MREPRAPAVIPTHSAMTPLVHSQPGHFKPISQTQTYYPIMCVVPLVGTGKRLDPVRPD